MSSRMMRAQKVASYFAEEHKRAGGYALDADTIGRTNVRAHVMVRA
jgi:hypothetical protein